MRNSPISVVEISRSGESLTFASTRFTSSASLPMLTGRFSQAFSSPPKHLLAVEFLAAAVLLDHHVGDFVDPLIGGEAALAAQALPAPADGVAFLALPRIHHFIFYMIAKRALHPQPPVRCAANCANPSLALSAKTNPIGTITTNVIIQTNMANEVANSTANAKQFGQNQHRYHLDSATNSRDLNDRSKGNEPHQNQYIYKCNIKDSGVRLDQAPVAARQSAPIPRSNIGGCVARPQSLRADSTPRTSEPVKRATLLKPGGWQEAQPAPIRIVRKASAKWRKNTRADTGSLPRRPPTARPPVAKTQASLEPP